MTLTGIALWYASHGLIPQPVYWTCSAVVKVNGSQNVGMDQVVNIYKFNLCRTVCCYVTFKLFIMLILCTVASGGDWCCPTLVSGLPTVKQNRPRLIIETIRGKCLSCHERNHNWDSTHTHKRTSPSAWLLVKVLLPLPPHICQLLELHKSTASSSCLPFHWGQDARESHLL